MKIASSWIKKLREAKTATPMTIFLLVLLGIVVGGSFVFVVSLLRLSLEDAEFWLKWFSAVLAGLVFGVGSSALVAGHFVNERLNAKVKSLEIEGHQVRIGLARAINDLDREEIKRQTSQPFARLIKLSCLASALGQPDSASERVAVRVLYQKDSRRVNENFAHKVWLGVSYAHWRLSDSSAEALSEEMLPNGIEDLVTIVNFGATGLLISPTTSNEDIAEGSPEDRLIKAFRMCGASFEPIKAFSPNTIFLVIGSVPTRPVELFPSPLK